MAGQRPGGIVLIAVLAWIGAALQIISGILVLTRVLNPEGVSTETAWVAIVVGVISFLVAFALFTGSRVARILVTISFVLSLISAIFSILAHPANFVGPLLAAIVAVIGLVLLYTKTANEYFRR
ncbi:hypothetical protein [Orlajensenia leifsoniae]|uniref:Uncharacterized protein n=1 Tax=Orlajensenia leifsoniae TaxID=2561933 RepID=A0A4Y9QQG4_9MICO|nr:hypothetical protein [Leifsonia flava]TFV94861.1 hypothetical protein E4M00_17045 [Leifsonia flava]